MKRVEPRRELHRKFRSGELWTLAGLLVGIIGCATSPGGFRETVYTLAEVSPAAPMMKFDRGRCEKIFGPDFEIENAGPALKCVREVHDKALTRKIRDKVARGKRLDSVRATMTDFEYENEARAIESEIQLLRLQVSEKNPCPNGSSRVESQNMGIARCESTLFARNEPRSSSSRSSEDSRAPASAAALELEVTTSTTTNAISRPCAAGWTYMPIASSGDGDPLHICAACSRGFLDEETTRELNSDERKFKYAGCPTDRPCVICRQRR